MREILFRGKRIDNGEWAFGYYYYYEVSSLKDQQFHVITSGKSVGYGAVERIDVIPETVGQYTGLIDEYGARIFEGDIVWGLTLYGEDVYGKCVFRDGSFGLEWERGCTEFTPFTGTCNIEFTVIGNIYDNPERIKGEQND